MIETPEKLISTWMSNINRGSVESLAELYDAQAVVIPTFSNRLLNTPEKIRAYFVKLTSREELSIALHENTLTIHRLHEEFYALAGIYCWRFAVDGEVLSFEAHFSFIINLKLPSPIIHHHSSQIPRTL